MKAIVLAVLVATGCGGDFVSMTQQLRPGPGNYVSHKLRDRYPSMEIAIDDDGDGKADRTIKSAGTASCYHEVRNECTVGDTIDCTKWEKGGWCEECNCTSPQPTM